MEVPLRLEPQAYGATIGPTGREAGVRLAAICAALVSLLAVCCVVLASDHQLPTTPHGLPGFELTVNSAMATFFKQTAARERAEAIAQQEEVKRLATATMPQTRPRTQGLVVAPNPLYEFSTGAPMVPPSDGDSIRHLSASDSEQDSSSTGGGMMQAMTKAVQSVTGPLFNAGPRPHKGSIFIHFTSDEPTQPKSSFVAPAPSEETGRDIGVAEHYSGSYLHKEEARPLGGLSPGVMSGATASAIANLQNVAGAMQEAKHTKKHVNVKDKAKTQRLATAPAQMHGLENKPWSAPASDFPTVPKQKLAQTKDFDVPVPDGMKPGQSFLVQVPGHREREVTVPRGVKPGQLVSIDVAPSTTLQEGEEKPKATPGMESANAESAGVAEEAGMAATVEAAAGTMNDASTIPVVFGESPEEQGAAEAVNAVHDLFRKEESVSKKWVPGDTQPIPRLQPLGQTTEDKWSSAAEVYGDQTALHSQSCAARCGECRKMGAGNWYCQKCGDVCNQLTAVEKQLHTYTWQVGSPRGAIDPMAQAELPSRFFRAIKADEKGNFMQQPMIPATKRWFQKTTQVTHINPSGITQITANPKWPVQSTAGLSALASLYKPDGVLPSNLPTLSSLSSVEGREYKREIMQKKQQKQLLELRAEAAQVHRQALEGEEPEASEEPTAGEESTENEGAGEAGEAGDGQEGNVAEKNPGFIVATPDDQGLEHGAVARKMTTNVNVIGPGGPSFVQIHTEAAENPQHFGAYAKPNFRSEYPTTQTITVNPTRPVVRMVASAAAPQIVMPQPVFAAPRPATSIVTSYQPAAMAAKQQTIQSTLGSGGLIFQVPAVPGVVLAPGASYSQTTTVNRVQPQWGVPSVSATTVTTASSGAPVQYLQAPRPTMQYVQAPRPTMQFVQGPTSQIVQTPAGASTDSNTVRMVAGTAPMVQVVHSETSPKYQSLSPIPALSAMPFFDKKKRARQALFRHWDGKEMKVLNVLPEKSDGAINLDPQNWQGQNMVISEGASGQAADKQFSEAMEQVTEGLHAAANSELHFKGQDRTGVTYREYGDVNPSIGEPVDPTVGGPKLIHSDPFGIRPKEASSPLDSINERAGAVPTGSRTAAMQAMVVKVPTGLKAGQQFTALTGDGHEEEVTVPAGVKAGGDVEISVPAPA